jgi:hypothetical protein
VTVSEKRMSGRRYDESLDLREVHALKGIFEHACIVLVRP